MINQENKKVKSRTDNLIRNTTFGIGNKVVGMLLTFASRTIFIYVLGKEYLGVGSLYADILGLLSVAELGFGSALNFALYGPIAEKNEEKIRRILDYYKRVYLLIASAVALIGITLIPFLKYIIKDADRITERELTIYYVIFLVNTVSSYLVTYKYSYVNAIQENYVTTTIDTILSVIIQAIQIAVLLLTGNYLFYLLSNSIVLLLSKYFVARILDRRYPILHSKPAEKIYDEEKSVIFKDVKGAFIYQISSVAVHSTDSIIITMLSGMGVVAVGYVSNYNLIINSVLAFTSMLFANMAAGYGNLAAKESTEHFRKVFYESDFLGFWIYSFCSVAFYILIPPFITLWIGEDYLIDNVSFILIILNCYLTGQSLAFTYARSAKGEYDRDRRIGIYQAVTNLAISVYGAKMWGLAGVFAGTVVSRLVYVLGRSFLIYRFCFGKSVKEYYIRLAREILLFISMWACTSLLAGCIFTKVNVASLILEAIFVFCFCNLMIILTNYKREEFERLWKRIIGICKK